MTTRAEERTENHSGTATESTWIDIRRAEKHPVDRASEASAFRNLARPLWILAVCALVVVLRQTREALIPLILAILISLIFSGVVEGLRRRRVPRAVSALVILLLGGFALGGAANALWTPAQEWIQSAPRILKVMEHKVRPARAIMQRLNDIAVRASALAAPGSETRTAQASAPTTGVTAADLIMETGWVAAGSVTVAALTLLLLSGGPPALARLTAALGGNVPAVHVLRTIDAIRLGVGRYYSTMALINLSLGVATTIAMWLLDMPTPMLWGAMAALLNFIPYLGSAVTLVTVTIVALVTFDSTPHVLLVGGTYLGLATIEGQLVEPIFFGRRLQLNPVVVFVALWLGGWLWGIAGILLAVPVLVAARVAAAQPGGNDVVLRFLGPEAHKPPDEHVKKGGESRIDVPTVRSLASR